MSSQHSLEEVTPKSDAQLFLDPTGGEGRLPMIEAGYWTDDQSIFPNDGRLALNGEAEGDVGVRQVLISEA
jgi:hypothetical protein